MPFKTWARKEGRVLVPLLSILILSTFFSLCFSRRGDLGCVDPDRYFHLAISKKFADSGLPRTLPQAAGLGWDRYFPDKEFLFHALTAAAYKIGGEKAVLAVIPALGMALILLLFFILRVFIPDFLAVFCIIPLLMSPAFVNRLMLLRPHLLAICLFLCVLWSILRRSPWMAALAGLGFSLAYHAVYLPLALLGIAILIGYKNDPARLKAVFYAVGGILCGILVNPYFPGASIMALRHLFIAFGETATSDLQFGTELYPWRSDFYVRGHAFYFVTIAGAALFMARHKLSPKTASEFFLVFIAAAFFMGLTAISPRAIEYAAPLASILLGMILHHTASHRRLHVIVIIAAASAVLQLPSAVGFYKAPRHKTDSGQEMIKAVSHLPTDGLLEQSSLFNCEWDITPYILYARPEYRFIDLLDPSFLLQADPHAHKNRALLLRGNAPDAFGLIRGAFQSNYVVCRNSEVIKQLEADAHFQRIYPVYPQNSEDKTGIFIYKASESRIPNQVLDFEVGRVPNFSQDGPLGPRTGYLSLTAATAGSWERFQPHEIPTPTGQKSQVLPTAYVNLFKYLNPGTPIIIPEAKQNDIVCAAVRVARSETRRLAGSTVIGIGGGRNVRLWWNGRPLYSSVEPESRPLIVNKLVPLPRPLRESDRIEAVVCSAYASNYMGLTISLWTKSDLKKVCSWKERAEPAPLHDGVAWKFIGMPPQNCLAPFAYSTR